LALNGLVFVGVQLALRIEHRQEINETGPALFIRQVNGQLALLRRLV
jgi:hypothetical protein